jgi:hypothetical protein
MRKRRGNTLKETIKEEDRSAGIMLEFNYIDRRFPGK